jgi:hypothetical protein
MYVCMYVGKLELDLTPFSIAAAVYKVQGALRGAAMQKQITVVNVLHCF